MQSANCTSGAVWGSVTSRVPNTVILAPYELDTLNLLASNFLCTHPADKEKMCIWNHISGYLLLFSDSSGSQTFSAASSFCR